MKKTPARSSKNDLRPEYDLDYSTSRPNRFASRLKNTTAVVLEPDVAKVFSSAEAVNDLLRLAIATNKPAKKRTARSTRRPKGRAA